MKPATGQLGSDLFMIPEVSSIVVCKQALSSWVEQERGGTGVGVPPLSHSPYKERAFESNIIIQ